MLTYDDGGTWDECSQLVGHSAAAAAPAIAALIALTHHGALRNLGCRDQIDVNVDLQHVGHYKELRLANVVARSCTHKECG
jgi:hypothetical protein